MTIFSDIFLIVSQLGFSILQILQHFIVEQSINKTFIRSMKLIFEYEIHYTFGSNLIRFATIS